MGTKNDVTAAAKNAITITIFDFIKVKALININKNLL